MKINTLFIVVIALIITTITLSSATTTELISPKEVQTQLKEGDEVTLTIKIEDYNKASNIVITTSLVALNNKPIYDFGTLNPSITENRYSQTITLNTSTLPQKEFQVIIAGKAPIGEVETKVENTDLIIRKITSSNKKYYEVMSDGILSDIKSFELIIKTEDTFIKTNEKITWKELDGTKKEVNKLFYSGLTTEAQNIANEMTKIKKPNDLVLFTFIQIESDLLLNTIMTIVMVIMLILGFVAGRYNSDNNENENTEMEL